MKFMLLLLYYGCHVFDDLLFIYKKNLTLPNCLASLRSGFEHGA